MNKYFFLLLSIFYFNKVVSQDVKNDTIKNQDTISISDTKIINKISFELINVKVNNNQLISNEVSYVKNNININERDTLSMIIQLKGGNNDIIFNYYFNGDYEILEDKSYWSESNPFEKSGYPEFIDVTKKLSLHN